jgi:hypothetical protein
VKRYHIEVRELAVPSDGEVEARKQERILTRLAAEGQSLPLDDFVELAPIARRIAEHEHRERIVALLLRRFLEAKDEAEEAPPPPPPREGGQRRRWRRR